MGYTYKLIAGFPEGHPVSNVRRSDGWGIPFDPANTDYQTFKKDVATGTPLEDPEGVLMTQAQVDEFLETIP